MRTLSPLSWAQPKCCSCKTGQAEHGEQGCSRRLRQWDPEAAGSECFPEAPHQALSPRVSPVCPWGVLGSLVQGAPQVLGEEQDCPRHRLRERGAKGSTRALPS